jgi:hypothetical protein
MVSYNKHFIEKPWVLYVMREVNYKHEKTPF